MIYGRIIPVVAKIEDFIGDMLWRMYASSCAPGNDAFGENTQMQKMSCARTRYPSSFSHVPLLLGAFSLSSPIDCNVTRWNRYGWRIANVRGTCECRDTIPASSHITTTHRTNPVNPLPSSLPPGPTAYASTHLSQSAVDS
jgi:hypothetical protein